MPVFPAAANFDRVGSLGRCVTSQLALSARFKSIKSISGSYFELAAEKICFMGTANMNAKFLTFTRMGLTCLGTVWMLTGCGTLRKGAGPPAQAALPPRWVMQQEQCAAATAMDTRIDVSLASFTAQLLGREGAVLAEMDISPGLPGHDTPPGRYFVSEKLPLKRSNLYGQYVRPESGEVVVARAWEHRGPRPEGTVYQGIAMPWWLRLTDDGVGIHVGGFSRGQPTSHGCIRCPEPGQRIFWKLSRVGTAVRVHHGGHPAPSLLGGAQL